MDITFQLVGGATIKANMPDYNAGTLATSLNDHRIQFIALGETGIHKNQISYWYPTPVEPTV
jgi:hypothetical protein